DVVVTANSDHYLINFMAEARIENSLSTPGAGSTIFMDLVAPDFVNPGLGGWATTSTERGGGFDVVPTTDGLLAVHSIWYTYTNTNRVTITQPLESSDYASAQKLTKTFASQNNNMSDVDVMLDGAGNIWILACGDDNGSSFVQVDPTDLTASLVSKTFTMTGDICFLDDLNGANTKARGTLCTTSGCDSVEIDVANDTITDSADTDWDSLTPDTIDEHNGILTIVDDVADGVMIVDNSNSYDLFDGDVVISADAMKKSGTYYVVAIVGDDVILQWGSNPAGTMDESILAFDTSMTDWTLTNVGLYVDGDYLVVAATGENTTADSDQVGWVVLAL
ncbi:MAG: hypothetical protein HN348_32580, partial [Proteobacteria bacterium]|nr:hypothetical protein [Pseudomonadota bacterium]